jgi:hypothetical protein
MNVPPVETKTSRIIPSKISCLINDYKDMGRLAKVDLEGSSPFSRSKAQARRVLRLGLFLRPATSRSSPI